MNKIILYFIFGVILVSCKNEAKNSAYDIDEKNAFFFENEEIKNSEARDLFNNGLQEIRKNNIEKAKTLLNKANDIEKDNPIILNSLGNYEFLYGKKSSSYQIFNKVLEIDSSLVLTYVNLGQNYMKDKEYKEASDILKKGLKYLPKANDHNKSILYLNLAITLNNLDDCINGLEYGEKALKHSQNSDFTKLSKTIINESIALCEKN